ncbi:plant intracellular Ras-group-related LRR protein 7 [Canna indica]|uniref:Plant intracellular Ras-group-related LRR protein 7 n=1 Tax=Canna indica TaxID=4628 RepID=A0AAQ3KD85_9LILI|nr:plant intracellular Ras-group-related LRR protein 7 [Canna indica]
MAEPEEEVEMESDAADAGGPIPFQLQLDKPLPFQVLADNLIEQLPTTIGVLRSVKVLILDGNRITNLPDELGFLSRLEKLSITGNSLICLPKTIGDLSNLLTKITMKYLGNLIKQLPSSVCTLVHLKFLSLNNNLIRQQLPENLLKDCKALQNVSPHDNPISMDQFQQMEGFEEFEERRKKKYDKQIDSNVMMSSKGLDEGIDL